MLISTMGATGSCATSAAEEGARNGWTKIGEKQAREIMQVLTWSRF